MAGLTVYRFNVEQYRADMNRLIEHCARLHRLSAWALQVAAAQRAAAAELQEENNRLLWLAQRVWMLDDENEHLWRVLGAVIRKGLDRYG